jgi:zinc protease
VFAPPVAARGGPPAEPVPLEKVRSVEGVTEYRLPNGLRVLLYPDPSTPKVSVICTVFVGSRHEGYGETGMAHLLEHMNIKNTPTHKGIKKLLSDRGAAWNATTGFDQTWYYETLPGTDENLEFAVRLEADRLVNTLFRHEDLASEMTVVRNEFEKNENDPSKVLGQRVLSAAYDWHNYAKVPIGNRSDIERIPIDRLEAFYHKHYRPENAMLILAGKFDEKKALEYTARYFGPLKNPAQKLDKTYTEEPAQDGERSVTLRRVGTAGEFLAGYHTPAAAHSDFAPLLVLAQVLGSGTESRLYTALVKSNKSSAVGAELLGMREPGMFFASTSVNQGQSADEVRRVLLDTIEGLGANKVTVDEVRRARAELTNGWDRISSHTIADGLRVWAGCGDWRLLFLTRDRVLQVTAEDVNRVAVKYLVRNNRTLGAYVPTERPERIAVPTAPDPDVVLKDYKGGKPIAPGEEFDPTPENIEKRLRFVTLASGVKGALVTRKTRGETVTLRLRLHYGSERSLAGLKQACAFLPAMMMRGTRGHSYAALDRELTELDNAGMSSDGDLGYMQFTLQCKREHLPRVIKLLGEVLREPTFPEDEFDRLKRGAVESLRANLKEPGPLAGQALERKLQPFHKDDLRYTPTLEEAIARIEATTLEQVRKLHETQIGGANGELVVVGDFDPDATVRQVEITLNGWTTATRYQRVATALGKTVGGGYEVINTPDKANAVYCAGHVLAKRNTDPDHIALAVGSYILGEPTAGSRLWDRVREKDGLSYHVSAGYSADTLDPVAAFDFYAICNPANIAKVRAAVAEEIERLLNDGVTADELAAAKKAILIDRRTFSDAELLSKLARDLATGDTFAAYIERSRKLGELTVEEVNAALRKHLQPKKLVVVEAGDFPKVEPKR